MTGIVYAQEQDLSADDYIDVLSHSDLGIRRPLDDLARVETMLANSNLIVTARLDGRCIGVARCLSDLGWVTYLADLAVHEEFQGMGVGKELVEKVRDIGGDDVGVGLFSVADAIPFYEKLNASLGMERENAGFWLPRKHGV